MNYEEMKQLVQTHVCAQCGGELVLIWDIDNSVNRVCCGPDHTHNGFKQRLTAQQMVKRGQADEVFGLGAQKDLERRARESMLAFNMLPKADFGTGEAMTLEKVQSLITWAEMVSLNARLGHVCLYFGKPYRTIDGLYYQNAKRKKPYRIGTHPMSLAERIAYAVEDKDYASIAEAWLDDKKLPETGIGLATQAEISEPSKRKEGQFAAPVVHDHPARMAEKRAEWQLLRKLIPLEINEGTTA